MTSQPPTTARLRAELEDLRVAQDVTRAHADDAAEKAKEAVREYERR